MARFTVGVEVEHTRWTVVVVEVEADTKQEAERKAVGHVSTICQTAVDQRELGIGPLDDWSDDGGFSCCGINHDENWEEYNPDIKV